MNPAQHRLTPQQRAALEARDQSVSLAAGAGCGKTFVLTERFIAQLDPTGGSFPQGVASGDPTPESVLLWTRVEATGSATVRYEVATEPEFANLVASGEATTDADRDWTVRVDVQGLTAGTTYWYRFFSGATASPTGRTRTAPPADAVVPVRIALASCQDFGGRWFHAWQPLLDREVDLVLFIGDYIYVDWGPEFAAQHNLSYPELSSPGTYVDLGPLGLQYILRAGGSGYFRQQAVAPHLRSGKLKLVRGAPEFLYPAYAVYPEDADPKLLMPALTGLRHVAKLQQEGGRSSR